MKKSGKIARILIFAILLLSGMLKLSFAAAPSKGEILLEKAAKYQEKACYEKAKETYVKAKEEFTKEKNTKKAAFCREQIFNMDKIFIDYPYTKEDLQKVFKKEFKPFTLQDLDKWIEEGRVDYLIIDGKPRYFSGCLANLQFRYPEIRRRFPEVVKKDAEITRLLLNLIESDPKLDKDFNAQNYYIKPKKFLVTGQINVPRKELPAKGLLRIWFPYPVQIASQRGIEMIEVSPVEYWKTGPQIDNNIGVLYFEIPLEKLKTDLNLKIKYAYTHYSQHFTIDPKNVGEYDTNSPLYKEFTKSERNITITPEIKQQALEIVGDEKNPYSQAKMIYDYIIKNTKYSFMPHLYLDTLDISESQFVHEHGYGDCGAQGMYFSALCRSLGIPARSPGGYQVWTPKGGSHFWAEFYLPNYGWVPNDTTIALAGMQAPNMLEKQKNDIKEYFFAHQDPYRLVIQKNVDIPIYPASEYKPFFLLTLQMPCAECKTSKGNPTEIILQYFKHEITPFNN